MIIKRTVLFLTLLLVYSSCSKVDFSEGTNYSYNNEFKSNSSERICIDFDVGYTTKCVTCDCIKAFCVTISWGIEDKCSSKSYIDIDNISNSIRLVINTQGNEDFFKTKIIKNKFVFTDDFYFGSDIASRLRMNASMLKVRKGSYDCKVKGDLIEVYLPI